MKRSRCVAIALVVAAPAAAQSLRRTPVVQVVERVRPAVVNLTARQVVTVRPRSIFDDLFPEFAPPGARGHTSQSLGSGVLISPDGLIVTNEHVIEGAAEIKVRFADGKEERGRGDRLRRRRRPGDAARSRPEGGRSFRSPSRTTR